MIGKPDGWDDALNDMINQGKGFKQVNTDMKALYGEDGLVGRSTFQKHKRQLTGGPEIDEKLGEIGEAVKGQKEAAKPKPRPAWTKGKQKEADGSTLAKVINKGMYAGLLPLCKNKKLTEQDVQDVNLGGAVVGTVTYLVPGVNLDHPLIVLATRGIILYMKFKAVCSKVEEIKAKLEDTRGGIKQGWQKEEHK